MTEIPPPTDSVVTRIFDALENKSDPLRGHLGASLIGHHCDRWLWLSFRWAVVQKFPGRVRRLFRRGHNEEPSVLADLRMIGIDVLEYEPGTSKQYGFKDGHFAGSMDGLIRHGVPEFPKEQMILEIKTHSKKSFEDVRKNGVEKSKPQHFAQMQIYMYNAGVEKALYFAVCKDNDDLYSEIVDLRRGVALKLHDRAQMIIAADRMPEPCSTDPSWYMCKFCPAYDLCHQGKHSVESNCRTCAHSTAIRDGRWHCGRWGQIIPQLEHQRDGCDEHVIHPDLVPWPMTPGDDGTHVYYTIDDVKVRNGSGGYKSRELLSNPQACTGKHDMINMAKSIWPEAEIQG